MSLEKEGIEAYLLLVKQITVLPSLGDEFESEEDVDAYEDSINGAIDKIRESKIAPNEKVERLAKSWQAFKMGVEHLTNFVNQEEVSKKGLEDLGFQEVDLKNYPHMPDSELSNEDSSLNSQESKNVNEALQIEGEINESIQDLQLAAEDIGLFIQSKYKKGA